MDSEEIDELEELKGIRWSWLSPVILATSCIGSIIGDVSDLFTDLTIAMARHSIWQAEQRDFEESVTRDIERITNA